MASVPEVAAEPPRADAPLPAAGAPVHEHDAARDVEEIPVAVGVEVTLFTVRLLGDHLVEIGDEFRLALEHMVRGHDGVGLDLAVVGVLGEVAGRERDRGQVVDRLRLRADARVEVVGDPEALAGLESLRIVGRDGVELDAGVDQLQHDRREGGELVNRGDDAGSDLRCELGELADQTVTRRRIERGELGRHDGGQGGIDLALLRAGNVRLRHWSSLARL